MLILGLNKTTLLDYPGHVAAVFFTGGCNFRCPFCHNKDIVLQSSQLMPLTDDEIFSFLNKRRNVLTGVCITGGEPTLHWELPDLIRRIKALGYLVKLDTNGTNPQMLQSLIQANLIDYCAMDIKNAPEKYDITIGFDNYSFKFDLSAVNASIQILIHQQNIPYEFRTTVVKELHNEADMLAISQWIAGTHAYFLQSYVDSENVLCRGFHAHSETIMQSFAELCRQYVPHTILRSIQILIHQQNIPYEFRTTVVKELHNEADMLAISQWIAGTHAYFLQSYVDSENVLCRGFHAHSETIMQSFAELCRQYVPHTILRGI